MAAGNEGRKHDPALADDALAEVCMCIYLVYVILYMFRVYDMYLCCLWACVCARVGMCACVQLEYSNDHIANSRRRSAG